MESYKYKRGAIEAWLVNNDTSPMTGITLPSRTLTDDCLVKDQIEQFMKENNPCSFDDFLNAVFSGKTEALEQFTSIDDQLKAKNSTGSVALQLAAFRGSTVIVALLLKNGASLQSKDRYNKTALDYAKDEETRKFMQMQNPI